MGLPVTITSAHDGAVLEFYDYVGDSCKVSLRGSSFSGTASVHVLPDIPPLDLPSLETFFRGILEEKACCQLQNRCSTTELNWPL
jgi:hypothetical protein